MQLKKRAEGRKTARTFDPNFSKYALTVDGATQTGLSKRALAHEVVKAAISKGLSPEEVAALIPPNKWISVAGKLNAEEFREQASKLQAKLGGTHNLSGYFCGDDDLFHVAGRTYALSNQWSSTSIPVLDQIIAKLPPGSVSYAKTNE